MRNVFKLAAVAALGVGMAMSVSVPSYATTSNVTDAAKYFFDCLAKLGTDQNCGGPHEINRGTSSNGDGSSYQEERCHYEYKEG
jgi:predicted transcriptional regulator of viral defense system